MRRFVSALVFCASLLVLLSVFLFPPVKAKESVLVKLLNLPAPPPPNPLVSARSRERGEGFYDKSKPPRDDAPIDELLDYWRHQNGIYQDLRFTPEISPRVLERIMQEIKKDPKLLSGYTNILGRGPDGAEFIKELFDQHSGVFDRDERQNLKEWLKFNSPYYSNDLARVAENAGDTAEYVTNQDELLALARVDFNKAKPILDRLYNDTSLKTSRVLARWAFYRHALDTDALGEIEQYRDELKAIVEDKSALPGMRDLAMDALVGEKEWSGRDDWYFSLLGDETLADLRINGQQYTGLTTLMLVSPEDKYVDKMLELLNSNNKVIRAAAVRNLITRLDTGGPEVIKALLPWLGDPNWAGGDAQGSRALLARKLGDYKVPESVHGLIKVLDERQTAPASARYGSNAIRPATNVAPALSGIGSDDQITPPANMAVIANRAAANAMKKGDPLVTFYPFRREAISALGKQQDGRAAPHLRRVLSEVEGYERGLVVGAILACGGFSIQEQLNALESLMKKARDAMNAASTGNANASYLQDVATLMYGGGKANEPITPAALNFLLGQQLSLSDEISDELARAIVDRIDVLDKEDPNLAATYRSMILKWKNPVFNVLLLRDLKRDAADVGTVIRLLGQRKELREKQAADIYDLQTGKGAAVGIAACLFEEPTGFDAVLDSGDIEAKVAMLAGARLIRAPLPVAKVAENLKAPSQILQTAAERYLEAEDSPEARGYVLARHPNEAKILGATTAFFVDGATEDSSEFLWMLYRSLGDNSLYNGWMGSGNDEHLETVEKQLQAEVKKDTNLLGVYAYDDNYIRIYNDRVMFSWDEDDSRYRERPLTSYEFDEIKSYLTAGKVDELPPFLTCGGDYCGAKELIMLGRSGGRRVYINMGGYRNTGRSPSEFFAGLDRYFADLKLTKATLKYNLSRDIPGLEILLASDELHAETVWKNGADLRVAAGDVPARKKVKKEIEEIYDNDENVVTDEGIAERETKRVAAVEKRRYEGYAWYKVANGEVAGAAAQPPRIEFIPLRDAHAVQPDDEQWKARAPGFEIRASDNGLFKVANGKLTQLLKGDYQRPVITPNGRWVVVTKFTDDQGPRIVRVDLATNKEFPVKIASYGEWYAQYYVPTLNKVLIGRDEYYDYDYHGETDEGDDITPADAAPTALLLLDPTTGLTQPIAGEFRPLDQITFRPLQPAANPNEFWAAITDPEKDETQVGIYDIKVFGFKPVLRIPKIRFNSMSMWVDEPGGKVYFVYRGHLLALPLTKN